MKAFPRCTPTQANSTNWVASEPYCAFSLLELLVVIAIVGVLLALLLLAVSRTRNQADRAQCLSNSRQVALAWTIYAGDFNDKLAPNVDGKLGGDTNWVAGNMSDKVESADRRLLMDQNRSLLS